MLTGVSFSFFFPVPVRGILTIECADRFFFIQTNRTFFSPPVSVRAPLCAVRVVCGRFDVFTI